MSAHKVCTSIGALCFTWMGSAHGVNLNDRGTGQVLLFPFYTVNAGTNTLFSIVNTTGHYKALRVRMAEGENGRDALSINVYLGPYDTWTAAIFDASDYVPGSGVAGPAGLLTNDGSCTVPAIRTLPQPHVLPDGRGFVPFSNAAFSGSHADAGASDLSRTREGMIEVIEMGTLIDNSPTAYAAYQACVPLIGAWAPGGYWTQDPKTDLANPTGGLFGTGYVVNVAQGRIFSYSAVAIDDFRADPLDHPRASTASVVMHTAPGSPQPSLADALTDPARGLAKANVSANGTTISATYVAPANAVDAVTAVLTASVLGNEFSFVSSEGATTNYVLSYPTRRFYTDPAIAGASAVAPFTQLFAGIRHDTETETVPMMAVNREGQTPRFPCPANGCDFSIRTPGTSVELLNFGDTAGAILGSQLNGGLGLEFGDFENGTHVYFATEGWTSLYFDGSQSALYGAGADPTGLGPVRFMRASIENKYFAGLPVIGFAAQNLVNNSVSNGVLANYSSAVPHRIITNCYTPESGNLQPRLCQ